MPKARLMVVAVVVAIFVATIGAASCSGKEGTCAVAPCGGVYPVSIGFICEGTSPNPPYATYATIARAAVRGPCTADCSYPDDAATNCQFVTLTPTAAGTCNVEVTSSTGETFPLTYVWFAQPVSGCPGCTTLQLADAGSPQYPFVRQCDGGLANGG